MEGHVVKNILVYTSTNREFSEENQTLVKVQIDNSLSLGWLRKDILLYTNFPYEYNGVKATVVDDRLQFRFDKTGNKILVIHDLLKNNALRPGLYWYHDFDAFQNHKITEKELGLDGVDIGLTGYGYKEQVNGGSFFFRETATKLFEEWCNSNHAIVRTRGDEKTMTDMLKDGRMKKFKYKMLNITYNFGMRHTRGNYLRAEKPLKVLHFHPNYDDNLLPYPTKDTFFYGKNPLGIVYVSDRLKEIFKKHGIE